MNPLKHNPNSMDDMDSAMIDSQRMEESRIAYKILEKLQAHANFKRVKAFEAIDGERKYEDELNKMEMSVGDELTLLRIYLRKAEEAFSTTFGDVHEKPTMDIICKLAGICVRCMENHGVVSREVLGDKFGTLDAPKHPFRLVELPSETPQLLVQDLLPESPSECNCEDCNLPDLSKLDPPPPENELLREGDTESWVKNEESLR